MDGLFLLSFLAFSAALVVAGVWLVASIVRATDEARPSGRGSWLGLIFGIGLVGAGALPLLAFASLLLFS